MPKPETTKLRCSIDPLKPCFDATCPFAVHVDDLEPWEVEEMYEQESGGEIIFFVRMPRQMRFSPELN